MILKPFVIAPQALIVVPAKLDFQKMDKLGGVRMIGLARGEHIHTIKNTFREHITAENEH